ncbi:MAG: hypothetical protein NUV46_00720 [Nanoarchaeota archaeon]|nr:hypothetical protein [Nanoarchaeota archaeon]
MDQNSETIDEKKKTQIEEQIVRSIITAYERREIEYYELKEAAKYTLDHIDNVKTYFDLLYFLENLSGYWKIFKNILTLESGVKEKMKEQEIINRLSQHIKNIAH